MGKAPTEPVLQFGLVHAYCAMFCCSDWAVINVTDIHQITLRVVFTQVLVFLKTVYEVLLQWK